MVMTSMMLYLDRMTNVNRESPEYSITQLFSDIGGAAGLMLGMSFATVIGIIDWLISFLTNLLMGRYRTVRRLTRKYSERRRQRILDNMPIKHIGTEPISPDISILHCRWNRKYHYHV